MIKLVALSLETGLYIAMHLQDEYLRYIEELTGTTTVVKPLGGERAAKLPLYLRSYYDMAETEFFDRKVLLALQNPESDTATPTEYAQHHEILRSTLGSEVVLVLPRIASYGRQQLIRLGVPFIVPKRQMFLPHMAVDLREHFPHSMRQPVDMLSPAAQVILLLHLLGRRVQGVSLRELAGELGYSAMTLSIVRSELEALGLSKSARHGRSTHLVFQAPMRSLWEQAEPHLQSPARARHWIRWGRMPTKIMTAGLTALEATSMVSDDARPTCAMKESDYRAGLEKGLIVGCAGPELAQARVECWRYDPRLLSEGPTVDRLSLFLSLRDTGDERVAKALRILLAEMPW